MFDLLGTRPKLKPNLQFVIQRFGDEACCIVEDPGREQFWRIGLPEWRLLNRFDGTLSVAEAAAQEGSEDRLLLEQARTVISWAIQEGLIENLRSTRQAGSSSRWMQAINASVFYRYRLGNPQPALERIYPFLGFLTHPAMIVAWLATLLISGLLLVSRWDQFGEASLNVVAPNQWLHFILIWWGLKFVHEVFHGLTCLRYGGNVREAGILFLLFAPLGAYVDVTSSWRFSSKWHRIHVTFAGIYVELLIAAIAAIGWCFASDPLVRQLCLQTTLLASVATVLFNANPLIRFDGYYLLADLLEIPNLYQQGQLATRQLVSRLFMGRNSKMPPAKTRKAGLVLLYGLVSAVWRVALCAGIAVGAATLLDGAGLLLAIVLVLVWWVLPLVKLGAFLLKSIGSNPLGVLRAATVAGLLAAAMCFSATRLRVPHYVAAPGIVQSTQSTVVRTEASGLLSEVEIRPGQRVRAGQIIGTLSNPELDLDVLQLRQEVKRNAMRVQSLLADGKIAEGQAEEQVGQELHRQLQHRLDQQRGLVIRSPQNGVVMDFEIDRFNGHHFRRGDRFIEIADPDSLEFAFSVGQSDHSRLDGATKDRRSSKLFLPGMKPIECVSDSVAVDPQARFDLIDPALAATHGGPIPVAEVVSQNRKLESRTLQPRLHGRVAVPQGSELTPGLVGTLRVSFPSQTVAMLIRPWLDRYRARLLPQLMN
jgi:putative peptide zinc metalloprotease protein